MVIDGLSIPSRHFMLSFNSHTIVTVNDIDIATDMTLAIALATTSNLVTVIANAYLKISLYFQSSPFIHLQISTSVRFIPLSVDLPHFIFSL